MLKRELLEAYRLWHYHSLHPKIVQNISPCLIGSYLPANSSSSASVDQIWTIFAHIGKNDLNCTDIDRKEGH